MWYERAEAISMLLLLTGFICGLSTGNIMSATFIFAVSLLVGLSIQVIAIAIDRNRKHKEKT